MRNFGHFISSNPDVPCFSWNEEIEKFVVDSEMLLSQGLTNGDASSHEQHNNNSANTNGTTTTTNSAKKTLEQRNVMMKALAEQKLKVLRIYNSS